MTAPRGLPLADAAGPDRNVRPACGLGVAAWALGGVGVGEFPDGAITSRRFTVSIAISEARLPGPQATITSIEFGPGRLHDGALVRFASRGFLVHMITAARGRNAAGARRIARLLQEGKAQSLATGFRPFDNILTRGACQQQVIRDRPGRWVLAASWIPRTTASTSSPAMERVIRIVR